MKRSALCVLLVIALSYQITVFAKCPEGRDQRSSLIDKLLDNVLHGDGGLAKQQILQGFAPDTKNGCGATLLHAAATKGDDALVSLLISKHADVNVQNWQGSTPLSAAAMVGQTGIVDILLANGADPNIADTDDESVLDTPLFLAIANDHLDIVKALLKHHADPCWKNLQGEGAADVVDHDPKVSAQEREYVLAVVKQQCPAKPKPQP